MTITSTAAQVIAAIVGCIGLAGFAVVLAGSLLLGHRANTPDHGRGNRVP